MKLTERWYKEGKILILFEEELINLKNIKYMKTETNRSINDTKMDHDQPKIQLIEKIKYRIEKNAK